MGRAGAVRKGRAEILVSVAVVGVVGGGLAAEEVEVDLAGEGEVGGDDAEVEFEVGPDGGDGVGPWVVLTSDNGPNKGGRA